MNLAISLIVLFLSISLEGEEFPHTRPLEMDGDLSVRMVSGISIFLDKKIQLSRKLRKNFWNRNNTSDEAYVKSIEKNTVIVPAIVCLNPKFPGSIVVTLRILLNNSAVKLFS